MNAQLKEELPQLNALAWRLLHECIANFVQLATQLAESVLQELRSVLQVRWFPSCLVPSPAPPMNAKKASFHEGSFYFSFKFKIQTPQASSGLTEHSLPSRDIVEAFAAQHGAQLDRMARFSFLPRGFTQSKAGDPSSRSQSEVRCSLLGGKERSFP